MRFLPPWKLLSWLGRCYDSLLDWAVCWWRFEPHFVIGSPDNPYMLRWHLLPHNRLFNVYLHKFLRDDDDRALHDHPWRSLSILVLGDYIEQTCVGRDADGEPVYRRRRYQPGNVICRRSEFAHRIELVNGKPAWTIFVRGAKVRDWGFHCPQGWVYWEDFVMATDKGQTGKGCAQ